MSDLHLPDFNDPWIQNQTQLILRCYRHWTGRNLLLPHPSDDAAQQLFEAPFAILSSGNEPDPLLNYGNLKALFLWETNWKDLRSTPGRETAEAMEQDARARFLKQVQENGFIENYQGVRISKMGKRFLITGATVWNLINHDGEYCGQAAMIPEWRFL